MGGVPHPRAVRGRYNDERDGHETGRVREAGEQ